MFTHVVSERKMANNMLVAFREDVGVNHASAMRRGIKRAVAASLNTILAVYAIADRFHGMGHAIERGKIVNNRHQIENRLGNNAGDSRGADMMDCQQNLAKNAPQALFLEISLTGPTRIVGHQFNGAFR